MLADAQMTSAETGFAPSHLEFARQPHEIVDFMYGVSVEAEKSIREGDSAIEPAATKVPKKYIWAELVDKNFDQNMMGRYFEEIDARVDFVVIRSNTQIDIKYLYTRPTGMRVVFVTEDLSLAKQTSLINGVDTIVLPKGTLNSEIKRLIESQFSLDGPVDFQVFDWRQKDN
jgi:hypothetical protein